MQQILDYYYQLASNNYVFYTFITVVVLFVIFNITKRWFWVWLFGASAIVFLLLTVICAIDSRILASVGSFVMFVLLGWASHGINETKRTIK